MSSGNASDSLWNATGVLESGEPSRTRTCDPLVKSQLLYQLSYRPTNANQSKVSSFKFQVCVA